MLRSFPIPDIVEQVSITLAHRHASVFGKPQDSLAHEEVCGELGAIGEGLQSGVHVASVTDVGETTQPSRGETSFVHLLHIHTTESYHCYSYDYYPLSIFFSSFLGFGSILIAYSLHSLKSKKKMFKSKW